MSPKSSSVGPGRVVSDRRRRRARRTLVDTWVRTRRDANSRQDRARADCYSDTQRPKQSVSQAGRCQANHRFVIEYRLRSCVGRAGISGIIAPDENVINWGAHLFPWLRNLSVQQDISGLQSDFSALQGAQSALPSYQAAADVDADRGAGASSNELGKFAAVPTAEIEHRPTSDVPKALALRGPFHQPVQRVVPAAGPLVAVPQSQCRRTPSGRQPRCHH